MKFALTALAFVGFSASSAFANQTCTPRTSSGPNGTCTQTCAGNIGSVTCVGNFGNMPQCYTVDYNATPAVSTSRPCGSRPVPGKGTVVPSNPMEPAKSM